MITCWCLLAFVKAADTRQNASFAVKKKIELGDVPDDPLAGLVPPDLPRNTVVIDYSEEPEELPEPEPMTPEEEMDAFFRQFEEMETPDFDDGFTPLNSNFDLFEDELLGKESSAEDYSYKLPRRKRFPYKGGDDR